MILGRLMSEESTAPGLSAAPQIGAVCPELPTRPTQTDHCVGYFFFTAFCCLRCTLWVSVLLGVGDDLAILMAALRCP